MTLPGARAGLRVVPVSGRAARAGLTLALLSVGLGAAWLVPAISILVVWPLLLVVPGWILVAFIAPRVDFAGRLGLAIVCSVVLATHLAFGISLLLGDYNRGTVFGAVALLALLIPISVWRSAPSAPRWASLRALPAVGVALLAAGFVASTLMAGLWRVMPDGVYAGGSNWSDLGVHLSIAQTLNAGGNFPPEVPYFAGVPLVYHWFADFHAAILAEAAGLFSVPAMITQSAVLAASLALVVFSLARRLLRGPKARRAAMIAAGLAVFAGGLGWIRLVGDVSAGAGTPLELIARNSYDNVWFDASGQVTWPYFRIPSVMGTGLLAHRATTAGLPIAAGAILLLVAGLPGAQAAAAGWRDNPWAILAAGLLGALLAPFHFFFFPVVPLLVLAWVVASGRMADAQAPRNAALFLLPYLLAIPWVIGPVANLRGVDGFATVWGWRSLPQDGGAEGVAFFYLTNLGIPFALALAALIVPGTPRRLFLGAWLVVLFAVPNVVQLSLIDFDMNKYFQLMWIAVAVLAAWLVRHWPLPAVALVFLLSVPSPLLVAGWTASSSYQVISGAELAAAEWAASSTPPGAVFLTNGHVNSFTDAAGRLRLTTFDPYVANLGYDPRERSAAVRAVYCIGNSDAALELTRAMGADYIVDGVRPQPCETPTDFAADPRFELAYANEALRIWSVSD